MGHTRRRAHKNEARWRRQGHRCASFEGPSHPPTPLKSSIHFDNLQHRQHVGNRVCLCILVAWLDGLTVLHGSLGAKECACQISQLRSAICSAVATTLLAVHPAKTPSTCAHCRAKSREACAFPDLVFQSWCYHTLSHGGSSTKRNWLSLQTCKLIDFFDVPMCA